MATTTQKLAQAPFRTNRDSDEKRQEKREALLKAAVRMFNERGFHATSLDDVAASVGVTKPVIYHHLGAKDQVLFECVRIGLRELLLAADRARAEPGTGLDRLKAFLRRYAEVMMDDFGKCVVRTSDESLSLESRAKYRALKSEIDHELRNMIEAASADGSAHVGEVRLTAFAFAGALNWPGRWFHKEGEMSAEAVANALVDILCKGIEHAPRFVPAQQ